MQVRDFIYVDDIVEAIIGGLAFKGSDLVCNIGTGIGTSFLKLMTLIESELGIEIRPLKRTAPVGYVPSIVADISVAAREIGFCPKFTINEGIALTLKTVLTNGTVAKLKGGLQDWIN
jgi:nucleoside-diphosphate-sugar epimerase